MSRCKRCDGKGFIEGWMGVSASYTPSIEQCPERCDISAYSEEIQRRLNNPNYVTERPVLKQAVEDKPLARANKIAALSLIKGGKPS